MQDQSFSAYIMAAVICLVFLLVSVVIANLIKFEGGTKPKDPRKRKIWFWIMGILCPIVTFLVGFIFVRSGIQVPSMQDKYTTALCIGTSCGFVLYIVLGFVLSKIFKHGKIGNWF